MSTMLLLSKSEQVLAPRTTVIVDGAARDVIPSWVPNADATVAGLVENYRAAGHTVRTLTWTPTFLTQAERQLALHHTGAGR